MASLTSLYFLQIMPISYLRLGTACNGDKHLVCFCFLFCTSPPHQDFPQVSPNGYECDHDLGVPAVAPLLAAGLTVKEAPPHPPTRPPGHPATRPPPSFTLPPPKSACSISNARGVLYGRSASRPYQRHRFRTKNKLPPKYMAHKVSQTSVHMWQSMKDTHKRVVPGVSHHVCVTKQEARKGQQTTFLAQRSGVF